MSQIVGTQAVMNVLTGERWKIVSKEMATTSWASMARRRRL